MTRTPTLGVRRGGKIKALPNVASLLSRDALEWKQERRVGNSLPDPIIHARDRRRASLYHHPRARTAAPRIRAKPTVTPLRCLFAMSL